MRTTANRLACVCLALPLALLGPRSGNVHDHRIEKKVFTLPSFTTVAGDVLKDVRFGYETHGELNAAKDNAILVLPYFPGSGHAAGKLAPTDRQPGY
jgi:homoserine O-acetyltransferase